MITVTYVSRELSPKHHGVPLISAEQKSKPMSKQAEWAQRARDGGRCFTDNGTFTAWGAECVADAMRTLGKSVSFASQWDGLQVYTWSTEGGGSNLRYGP